MKTKSRSIVILSILFGYIILQFLWWELLLVKQNGLIIDEKQKLTELSSTNEQQLLHDLSVLHRKKTTQTVMIVSEGTVFLLLLLFGIYKIKQSMDKETVLNERQRNFFLSVTHELKTPIAATKLQLQTLQKQKLDENTQKHLLQNALLETERLNGLIDNILLASRLESDEVLLKKEKQNLSMIIPQVLNRYYLPQITSGDLVVDIEPDVFCTIDVHAFPSIITNLVDNAIKYSVEKIDIRVGLHRVRNEAIITVTDKGCGIPNKDKEYVFTKFYRAGNEETRRTKGTGLGLFIVNYLVEKHKGKIGIKDNTPAGTVFELKMHVS
ncbi:MAG: HAMP domain-containing sensor histidine kinase [bacterium]|nr:HAMP domain-containing sensor histidine kinase [bacterium]